LLRLAYQAARKRQLDAQAHRGFTDLNQTLLSVLVFPPPDGVGPTELANRTHMTKQAMNYLLGQLERLGYVERRSANGGRSLVYLTRKGWDVFETQWAAMRQLEKEWAELIGGKRFATFMQVLRELAATNSAYVGNQASGGAKTERGR
jgi:DNA-binding MarR family transcriptional regulator